MFWGRGYPGKGEAGEVEAARPIRYSGDGLSQIGDKGRFVLPSEIRKTLRESGDGERVLCLSKHPRWKALVGFGLSRIEELEAELEREERYALDRGHDFDRDLRAQQLYGYSRLPFDDSGRFVMPDRHFRLAGIEDRVFFRGMGRSFLIWNPDVLMKMGPGFEEAQEACADLIAQAASGKAKG